MRIPAMGKRWLLVWVAKGLGFVAREPRDGKKQTKMSQSDDGMTEAPWFKNKRLFLRHGIRNERRRMEAAIHEFTHAADWYKDEEWVEQFGHDLTNFLYMLGVRWPDSLDAEPEPEEDPEILEG